MSQELTSQKYIPNLQQNEDANLPPEKSALAAIVGLFNTAFLFFAIAAAGAGGFWLYQNQDQFQVKKKAGQTTSQAWLSRITGRDVSRDGFNDSYWGK